MITLISGDPGTGKTAYAVSLLVDVVDNARPVYVMGIDDLKIPHYMLPSVAEWTEVVPAPEDNAIKNINFTFESGSIIVIDEAQRIFRPRPSASRVPDYIAAFETHRHLGLDFILITQFPTLIDSNIRHLVSKHIHLRSTWAGRQLLEWSEVSNPENRADRSIAVTRKYSLPKNIFDLYKSATVHVKQTRRIPITLYVFLICVLAIVFFIYYFYGRVNSGFNHQSPVIDTNSVVQGQVGAVQSESSQNNTAFKSGSPLVSNISYKDFIPTINTRPESAPVYNEIRKVKSMPYITGCISSGKNCRCYTNQATDVFFDTRPV